MHDDARRSVIGYAVAALAVTGAVLLRWSLDPLLGDHLPLATLCGAVAVAASKIARNIAERKRLEAALQGSERRFRTLTSHAPVGIFETDSEGNCLFVNERWCAMAGMSPDQARGQGWVNALHPEDGDRIHREWYDAAKAGREFASEYRFRTPQGKVTWLSGGAVALRDEGGQIRGYIGTVTDITERKQSENWLRESEEKYRSIVETANEGIWRLDAEARITFVNRQMAE